MTLQRALPHRNRCRGPRTDTPTTRETLCYLIASLAPSRGGSPAHCGCLHFEAMNWLGWWTMEFIFVDVGATLLVLLGYLAVVIRRAVV